MYICESEEKSKAKWYIFCILILFSLTIPGEIKLFFIGLKMSYCFNVILVLRCVMFFVIQSKLKEQDSIVYSCTFYFEATPVQRLSVCTPLDGAGKLILENINTNK